MTKKQRTRFEKDLEKANEYYKNLQEETLRVQGQILLLQEYLEEGKEDTK